MYILKFLAMICVAAFLGASSLRAQPDDSDAQTKAREVLRQKLADINVPAPAPADAATNLLLAQADNTANPYALTNAPAPAVTAPPASLSPADEAKLRAALRQAIATAPANVVVSSNVVPSQPMVVSPVATTPSVMPTPAPAPVAPATNFETLTVYSTPQPMAPPAAAPPVTVSSGAFIIPGSAASSQLTPEEQAKVLQAMRQGEAQLNATDPQHTLGASTAIIPAPSAPAMSSMPASKMSPNYAPEVTPVPAMVPGSKEQKLYDLLQLYKQDKISPADYHQQRAKIVAEP